MMDKGGLESAHAEDEKRQMKHQEEIPFLEVTGSPREIGYEVGAHFKDSIRKVKDRLIEAVCRIAQEPPSEEKCLALASKHLSACEAYAPELVEEVKAIAEGADSSFEEVFFLNCFSDVLSEVFQQDSTTTGVSCSAFGVSAEATKESQVLIGQTFDLNTAFRESSICLRVRPKTGPSSLLCTIAGTVGCIGQNSAGIAVANNKLFCSDNRPGIPFTFVARKVLEQSSTGDAIETVLEAHRATGLNYLLGDSNGTVLDLETTAGKHEVFYCSTGFVAHSNHYLSERLRPYQTVELGDSVVRLDRMNRILRTGCGSITREHLQQMTRDHINYPKSICNHPDEKLPEHKRMRTISAVIMQPASGKMWVTSGNPCETRFLEYVL